jgi:tRNA (guanine-N7-)-methyltransferase
VGKNKLRRFAENETFSNLIQTEFTEYFGHDHPMKGQWRSRFFRNSNPIVLELGCGKGEYTIGLARQFPGKNFIGIDIKGARLWRGAKTAMEQQMPNVAFVRTRIEIINSFFAENEVDEVWLTFPDPQPRQAKALKRLSSSRFLSKYRGFLRPGGVVHLKTDSLGLHRYTRALAEQNGLTIHACTENLYETMATDPILSIKTFYEQQFLGKGMPITYISFELNNEKPLAEPSGQP